MARNQTQDPMQLFSLDDSRMPLRLGSALRVPSYAYPKWGIPYGSYREESDACYMSEWAGGTKSQVECVRAALAEAGMLDYTNMLRQAAAQEIAGRVRDYEGQVNILDIGGGDDGKVTGSTIQIFDALEENDKDRVGMVIVNPSFAFANAARVAFAKRGFTNYLIFVDKDTRISEILLDESQQIVANVATMHHHAYLDTPFRAVGYAIAAGGVFVSADRHNPEWEHPARVLKALEEDFEWETKGADIDAFKGLYLACSEQAPPLIPEKEASYMQIRQFWQGWAKVRAKAIAEGSFVPEDDIYMLEGHRPVSRYEAVLAVHGGFRDFKSRALVEGSEILTVLTARRKA